MRISRVRVTVEPRYTEVVYGRLVSGSGVPDDPAEHTAARTVIPLELTLEVETGTGERYTRREAILHDDLESTLETLVERAVREIRHRLALVADLERGS